MEQKRVFRKGRNLAGQRSTFRAWGKFSIGDKLVLRYLDSKTDAYGKPAYRCECLDAEFVNEDGAAYVGNNITLNSNGMLDKAMADIPPGTLFMVTYNGKAKIQKGPYAGKESHTMDVDLVDEEPSTSTIKTASTIVNEDDENNDDEDMFF